MSAADTQNRAARIERIHIAEVWPAPHGRAAFAAVKLKKADRMGLEYPSRRLA